MSNFKNGGTCVIKEIDIFHFLQIKFIDGTELIDILNMNLFSKQSSDVYLLTYYLKCIESQLVHSCHEINHFPTHSKFTFSYFSLYEWTLIVIILLLELVMVMAIILLHVFIATITICIFMIYSVWSFNCQGKLRCAISILLISRWKVWYEEIKNRNWSRIWSMIFEKDFNEPFELWNDT